ncbi:hypothetical protein ETW23_05985 [Leisingera sp. NJS201]|uniref:hypothetical protein n=1 Tax=Leisingera sp. NJS201 TaxID=2508306 RepID=UPI0010711E27|nr:hypothetical protein [Leisingera sp. NJS201]QBR35760.1 hypothetical protein ETW23_05985 [Leisingera sp. NJS201]
MTSTELLTSATTALQAAADAYNARVDEISAKMNDLRGIVGDEMTFIGYVTPNEVNPTRVDGGTFLSIKEVIDASPDAANVHVYLPSDATFQLDVNIATGRRLVQIRKDGAGANPILQPVPYLNVANNYSRYFFSRAGAIIFNEVDLDLTLPAVDGGTPFIVARASVVTYDSAMPAVVAVINATVTGIGDGRGVVGIGVGAMAQLGLSNVTLDNATGIAGAANGVAIVSQQAVTLVNGGVLNDGGTLGQNLIKN